MQVIVSGQNLGVTDALKNYAQNKIGKLDKYFQEAVETGKVEMIHHQTKSPEKANEAKVIVYVHGAILSAREIHTDMYAAIDLLFEKLEKQLKKYKDKIKHRKREKTSVVIDEILKEKDPEPTKKGKDDPIVYRVQSFVKPMDVEEAVLQLQISDLQFLAFRNFKTSQVNVIYKRKDGDFGLIDPE